MNFRRRYQGASRTCHPATSPSSRPHVARMAHVGAASGWGPRRRRGRGGLPHRHRHRHHRHPWHPPRTDGQCRGAPQAAPIDATRERGARREGAGAVGAVGARPPSRPHPLHAPPGPHDGAAADGEAPNAAPAPSAADPSDGHSPPPRLSPPPSQLPTSAPPPPPSPAAAGPSRSLPTRSMAVTFPSATSSDPARWVRRGGGGQVPAPHPRPRAWCQ